MPTMERGKLHLVLMRVASFRRALAWIAVFGWLIGFSGIVGLSMIETNALGEPRIADAVHRHPHQIKGQIRFLSDWEDQVDSIARPMMFAGMAIFFSAGALRDRLRRREEDERVQDVLRSGNSETSG